MAGTYKGPLEKIDNYRWRIPKSYMQGMRVDGVIYANKKLIEQINKDNGPQQVANVATLPGIVKYSLAMPDIHWGYGFCLTGNTKILNNLGCYKPIEDFGEDWLNQRLKNIDFNSLSVTETPIERFIRLKPEDVFRIFTKAGYEIKATGEHPFFTPFGMRPARDISSKERIAVFPFEGVPFEKPSNKTIITEEEIKQILLKLKVGSDSLDFEIILKKLKKYNLLPLSYNHPKLPYLLKIMGLIFGGDSISFVGNKGVGSLHFSGKADDLEATRKDLETIGYTPGHIHCQRVNSLDGLNKYYRSHSFIVNDYSLAVLLEALGVSMETKIDQAYRIPMWVFKAPLWQKRLFLASLFGSKLRMPNGRLNRKGYFKAPVFSITKREDLLKNGKDFLADIARLLKGFGVRVIHIDKEKKHINKKNEITWTLELIFPPKLENLINLWSRVGFEYNSQKSFLANTAVQYLRLKQKILKEKEYAIRVSIPQLLRKGLSYQKVAFQLAGNPLTERFITDICWKFNKGERVIPRIPANFPLFEDYLEYAVEGLGHSGIVWDEIVKIENVPYNDYVYDFTVLDHNHNFIANNFVVSNCIGGIAATDIEAGGVISPGGVGYDINCGVRLVRTHLNFKDIQPKLKELIHSFYNSIPAGVGSKGDIKVDDKEEVKILIKGARWALSKGYAIENDIENTEENGAMEGANPDGISSRAYERGRKQSGTLGSGNHFIEVQVVDEVYDGEAAMAFGIEKDQITVMIHSGSRGLGYQICDDYVKSMVYALSKYNINVPDRQLACAPFNSEEGRRYFSAMICAANYAWNNRQCLMHLVRMTFERIFNKSWQNLGIFLVYDVAHNIAKIEKHNINGKERILCVHRKGATRAFGPDNPHIPKAYQKTGQPVIIPGDMGRNSYLLAGTQKAMDETFGTTCHGAGRCLSRTAAIQQCRVDQIRRELAEKGIILMAAGKGTIAEEAPQAYKDVNEVVEVVDSTGISRRVCRMRPLGVLKG